MDNLEPLPYANIIIQGTGRGVTSDADGHFVLVDVPAEPCSLIISYIGYRTAKIGFDKSISQGPLEIRLKLEALNFQAVDVIADEYQIIKSSGDEVPIATIVRPTINGEMLDFSAKPLAFLTSVSPPKARMTRPPNNKT